MVSKSVSTLRLASNDVTSLAKIFESAFDHFSKHSSPFLQDYLHDLRTLVGLGFTITLVDGDLLIIYQSRLNVFLQYGHAKKYQSTITYLSQSIADMIDIAIYLFRLKGYPAYYIPFAKAVRKSVDNIITHTFENSVEVQRLLSVLLEI